MIENVPERARAEEELRRSEERLAAVFRASPVAIVVRSLVDGRFRDVNDRFLEMTGYARDEVIGRTPSEVGVWAGSPQEDANHVARLVRAQGSVRNHDGVFRTKAGEVRHVLLSLERVEFGGEPCLLGFGYDVTERRRMEAELRRSEERFRALVQNASDVITILGADGTVCYESPALERVLGYKPEELVGTDPFALIHPDDVAGIRRLFDETLRRPGANVPAEFRFRHKDGSWRWLEVIGTNLLAEPAVRGVVVNSRDITERKAFEARLEHEAYHDPLTGLPNRALFLDRLRHALEAAGRRKTVVVLFLDLDGFKFVNDSFGHEAGDHLLVAAGQRLQGSLPPGATLARFGGDEFAVLLAGVAGAGEATRAARCMLEALRTPFDVEGRETFVTANVGVSAAASGQADPGDLLREADTALYEAKGTGRTAVAVYEPRMRAAAVERLERQSDLCRALERGELRLRYQPKVELSTGRVVGAEALVRWEHPEHGLLEPADFIGLAEETGLIVPLGQWVLREACSRASAWRACRPGWPLLVCVNLSARQLRQPELVPEVAQSLEASGLDPCCLELEITEDAAMAHGPETRRTLRALKQLGVRLAIDDFGTGYSSLAYLLRLPFDALKVDRVFVKGLDRDAGSRAIVGALTTLAHELGLAVTAEGIETPEQAARLRGLGVDLGQGFFFAPPLTGEALTQFLALGSRLPEAPACARGADTDGVPAATAECPPPTMTGTASPVMGDDVEA